MEENKQLQYIDINMLYPHPHNPRRDLGDLSELAESIKAKGVMQNLTVVPRNEGGYTVIIGHRRREASKLAGLKALPCIVTEMTPAEQEATMLLENVQRSDLNAYEQAWGFQRLIHFGETVESISQKTGFSQTTVRRRVKMGELDQNTLRAISENRQISLGEIDELAKIEDLSCRNRLLSRIGTDSFQWEVDKTYKKQEAAKKISSALEKVKKLNARKIKRTETYNGNYSHASDEIDLIKWNGNDDFKITKKGKLYYYLDEEYGSLSFYVESEYRIKQTVKSKEDKEREERLAEIWRTADALRISAKASRERFVIELKPTNKNLLTLLQTAVNALAMQVSNMWCDKEPIRKVLGFENVSYITKEMYYGKVKDIELNLFPRIIFLSLESSDEGYVQAYPVRSHDCPVYTENKRLDFVYEALKSLGYRMSDEELAYQNGTHEIFDMSKEGKK